MKDFVYLDVDTITSISSQLFEGVILETSESIGNENSESIKDTRLNKTSENSGNKVGIKIASINQNKGAELHDSISNNWSTNESIVESTKKAYDDFLYNKVHENLIMKDAITEIKDGSRFDFVNIDGSFKVFDINTASKIFNTELLKQLPFMDDIKYTLPNIKELEKRYNAAIKYLNKPLNLPKDFSSEEELHDFYNNYTGTNIIRTMNEITLHLDKVFSDKIIFSRDNDIIIANREWLRIQPELLSLCDDVSLKGFGRKLTQKDANQTVSEITQFENVNFENTDFLARGTQGVLLLFLQIVLGLDENDTFEIIQPVGLEYSKAPR